MLGLAQQGFGGSQIGNLASRCYEPAQPRGCIVGHELARHAQAENLGETMVERAGPAQRPGVGGTEQSLLFQRGKRGQGVLPEDGGVPASIGKLQVLGNELDIDEPSLAVLYVPQPARADLTQHLPTHVQNVVAKARVDPGCAQRRPDRLFHLRTEPGISGDDTSPGEGKLLPRPGGGLMVAYEA